ncbi:hypothetical protein STAS_07735 [Striga asiatica]|uniref:Uncharacterized protein n=1 Tax=Striga asiatica TaxID=4170 RepID=A0A5A7PFN3_STRAF|nr:hypothetical protein STAS_07735 [Striga asiatica]
MHKTISAGLNVFAAAPTPAGKRLTDVRHWKSARCRLAATLNRQRLTCRLLHREALSHAGRRGNHPNTEKSPPPLSRTTGGQISLANRTEIDAPQYVFGGRQWSRLTGCRAPRSGFGASSRPRLSLG